MYKGDGCSFAYSCKKLKGEISIFDYQMFM